MRIHRVGALVMSACVVASACSTGVGAPAATAPVVHGTLNEVMKGILFPNSNVIFDAQDRDPADPVSRAEGSSPYAGVYGGWEAIENSGIALAEAANLIMLPGRSCENGRPVPLEDQTYIQAAQGLREVGMAAYRIGQSRAWDQDVMFQLGDDLAAACAACHDVYRDTIVDGRPGGLEDRCME